MSIQNLFLKISIAVIVVPCHLWRLPTCSFSIKKILLNAACLSSLVYLHHSVLLTDTQLLFFFFGIFIPLVHLYSQVFDLFVPLIAYQHLFSPIYNFSFAESLLWSICTVGLVVLVLLSTAAKLLVYLYGWLLRLAEHCSKFSGIFESTSRLKIQG